jgi:hypothetical protein
MNLWKPLTFSLFMGGILVLPSAATAQTGLGPYQPLSTIVIPPNSANGNVGGLAGGFDISWFDFSTERFFIADRGTIPGAGQVDIIDAAQAKFLTAIPGFVGARPGAGKSGPDGVIVIPQRNELWVGDGDTTVKVVDLSTNNIVATIDVSGGGGNTRADEIAYDAKDNIFFITIPDGPIPYAAFISTTTRQVLGYYSFMDAAGGGIEQPAWDPQTNQFFINVNPASGPLTIEALDPVMMTVNHVYPTPCKTRNAGLALGPNERLYTSCGIVMDARNGNILANISSGLPQALSAADEIWYNPGDDRVYFGSPNVGVVDAETNQFVTFLFPGAQTGTSGGGHTIAVDSFNGYIFLPSSGGGVGGNIKVFAPGTYTQPPSVAAPGTGVTVVVNGPNPTGVASFQAVSNQIALDASLSTTPNPGPSFSWATVPGYPSASITAGNTARPSIQLSTRGVYKFNVTVTDSGGAAATQAITVQY